MPRPLRPLADRAWERVNKRGAISSFRPDLGRCWEWTGHINDSGYGLIQQRGAGSKLLRAHRVIYELEVGLIPEGAEIDHLCRVRHCVRPSHCEPVSRRVNQIRGFGIAGTNHRKTECPAGHPYDEGNTYRIKTGGRRCRLCNNAKAREYRARKKENETSNRS